MKKTKSLVITSLLFSTMILNPSMINAVVVNAATPADGAAQLDKTKSAVIVKYIDDTNNSTFIPASAIRDIPNNAKTVEKDSIPVPDGYTLSSTQDFSIQTGRTVTIHVSKINNANSQNKETKKITVFFIDSKNKNNKLSSTTIDVNKNIEKINSDSIEAPTGYTIPFRELIKIENNEIKVTVQRIVKTTTTVKIKFLDSTDNSKKFEQTTIEVPNGTKKIKGSTITAPEGYSVTGRELIAINNDNQILVHIKPINSNNGHEMSKSDVKVKYINDDKPNETIPNGVIKDLEDNATSVDKSRIPVPYGYKLIPDQNLTVSYGIIKVHVIPTSNQSMTVKPVKPNKKPGHSSTDATTYTNKVQFIDQATNKEIGSMKVSGLHGSKHKLVIPEGYALVKNESSEVKVDKSQKAYHVQVVKKTATAAKPEVTTHKTTFRTNKTTQLFNINGKAVRNRALMANTDWAVDKKMVLSGTTYYRVATNEWVKVTDGTEVTEITKDSLIKVDIFNKTITTSGNSPKRLYTAKGQLIGNRALAPNTPWFSDTALTTNGQTLYRVATNEWVNANDLV
ncbi:SLAP domain-containing protein [Companilactobacillus jidongensis]|uniref:SLAP domain-containing protein n=1 Tax=Companilactobacillus jidongensis TaxID=2486006 RepID=UPI000F79F168|nr:SLAP domain-containing protein [Companilactobacillus jidongensis]